MQPDHAVGSDGEHVPFACFCEVAIVTVRIFYFLIIFLNVLNFNLRYLSETMSKE